MRRANRRAQPIKSTQLEMAREGTRSATGNSKPRVFPVVDTAPAVKRTSTKPKTPKAAPATKKSAAKPTGVTKKKAAPKKESGVTKKVHLLWFPSAKRPDHIVPEIYMATWLSTGSIRLNSTPRSRLPQRRSRIRPRRPRR